MLSLCVVDNFNLLIMQTSACCSLLPGRVGLPIFLSQLAASRPLAQLLGSSAASVSVSVSPSSPTHAQTQTQSQTATTTAATMDPVVVAILVCLCCAFVFCSVSAASSSFLGDLFSLVSCCCLSPRTDCCADDIGCAMIAPVVFLCRFSCFIWFRCCARTV